jgi:hypothetical protein
VQRAPGVPCALYWAEIPAQLGRLAPREREAISSRHHPPPGLAFGEPDDRLQRMIQYPRDACDGSSGRSVTPHARGMTIVGEN